MKHLTLLLLFCIPTITQARIPDIDFEQQKLPLENIQIVFSRGTNQDPKGKEGLLSLLGSMLTRGTTLKSKEEFDQAVDQIGANIDVSASSNYFSINAACLSEHLPTLLSLVSEAMINPSFLIREFDKLKNERLSQIKTIFEHDASVAFRRFDQFLFGNHVYARPSGGTLTSIASIRLKDVTNHARYIFDPESIKIFALGNTDTKLLAQWADQIQQKMRIQFPATQEDRALYVQENDILENPPEPQFASQRRLELIDKPRRTQTQIIIGQKGITFTHPDYHALELANYSFGGAFSSTLMQEIRVKRGWSYGANSFFYFDKKPASWMVRIFPKTQDSAVALKTTLQLIDQLRIRGLTPSEFDLAKESLIASASFNGDTPSKRLAQRIMENIYGLKPGFFRAFPDEIEKVSYQEVQKAVKSFIQRKELSIAVLCSASDPKLKEQLIKASGVTRKNVKVVEFDQE